MRQLTTSQRIVLDRIASSPSNRSTRVVGWASDGPVLRVKQRLLAILPGGQTQDVQQLDPELADR